MAEYTHEGRQSFWDGKYRSLCGLEWPAKKAVAPLFATTTCPDCKRAKKARK